MVTSPSRMHLTRDGLKSSCGKRLSDPDSMTKDRGSVTCSLCIKIGRIQDYEIAARQSRTAKLLDFINKRNASGEEKVISEEEKMMVGYVPYDPNKDRTVKAKCLSCGKEYLNSSGYKYGLCSSYKCSNKEGRGFEVAEINGSTV